MFGDVFKAINNVVNSCARAIKESGLDVLLDPVGYLIKLINSVNSRLRIAFPTMADNKGIVVPISPTKELTDFKLKAQRFNQTNNAFFCDAFYLLFVSLACINVWSMIRENIYDSDAMAFLGGLGFLYTASQFIYLFFANKFYIPVSTSMSKKFSPSRTGIDCGHSDEGSLVKGITASICYELIAAGSVVLGLLAIDYGWPYLNMPNAGLGLSLILHGLQAILFGQGVLSIYLRNADTCLKCQFKWLSQHNMLAFTIGSTMKLSNLAVSRSLSTFGMNNFFQDMATFYIINMLVTLTTQSKDLARLEEPFTWDVTKPVRDFSDRKVVKHIDTLKKLITTPGEGPILEILRLMSTWYLPRVIITTTVPLAFRSVEGAVKTNPVQALLLNTQKFTTGKLTQLWLLQVLDDTYILEALKRLRLLDIKEMAPEDTYDYLRLILQKRLFRENYIEWVRELKANPEIRLPKFYLQLDWAAVLMAEKSLAPHAVTQAKVLMRDIQKAADDSKKQLLELARPKRKEVLGSYEMVANTPTMPAPTTAVHAVSGDITITHRRRRSEIGATKAK